MIDNMECPKCHGIKWVIWAEPFETERGQPGNLIVLTAECDGSGLVDAEKECGYKIQLGIVDATEMIEMAGPASE